MLTYLAFVGTLTLATFGYPVQGLTSAAEGGPKLVCYFNSSSYYNEGRGRFDITKYQDSLCTHIIYSYLGVSERTNRLYSKNPALDLGPGEVEVDPDPPVGDLGENTKGDEDMIRKMVTLRQTNPDLKMMISVGGEEHGSASISNMVRNIVNRTQFITTAVQFLVQYQLDGIDIAWEYPAQISSGGRPEDKDNLAKLFKELRDALDEQTTLTGQQYVLTGAFGCTKEIIDAGYDITQLRNLDAFHLMCFDLRMYKEEPSDMRLIGHHSSLHSKPQEPPFLEHLNIEAGVSYFLQLGAPSSKLVLGVSAHARTYELQSADQNEFNDEAAGPGPSGNFTKKPGFLTQYELCGLLREEEFWDIRFDYDYMIPYARNGNSWIGFDDPISTQHKVDYGLSQGLGGMMVQFIDEDDCENICGGWYPCPIVTSINQRLFSTKTRQ